MQSPYAESELQGGKIKGKHAQGNKVHAHSYSCSTSSVRGRITCRARRSAFIRWAWSLVQPWGGRRCQGPIRPSGAPSGDFCRTY